jgi:hypothetical protein
VDTATTPNADACQCGNSASVINVRSFHDVVAPRPATYAGDRLLTSGRTADIDATPNLVGAAGWPLPSHNCRAIDRSRSRTHARADDETRRYW